jgi:ribose 5-phosphate isomerase B
MKVFIGADHRGVDYKKKVTKILEKNGYTVKDEGAFDDKTNCDYPVVAEKVCKDVTSNPDSRGILVCMSGIGQSIVANKFSGILAALVLNPEMAELSRQHNNSNVLVLSSKFVKEEELESIIKKWMTTSFEGGRHEKRIQLIQKI